MNNTWSARLAHFSEALLDWSWLAWLGYHAQQLYQTWHNFVALHRVSPQTVLPLSLALLACVLGVLVNGTRWWGLSSQRLIILWGLPVLLIVWWVVQWLLVHSADTQQISGWRIAGSTLWLCVAWLPALATQPISSSTRR